MDLESPAFLRSPRDGPDVCVDCFNLTRGFTRCFACSRGAPYIAAMAPISYSIGHEYLHHTLASYKRLRGPRAEAAILQISAILSRFLCQHERCLARAAGVERFDIVTTVPSSDWTRDLHHPLHRVAGELVAPTRDRYERLLRRSSYPIEPHRFDIRRFETARSVKDARVLLIDDTWTTGASAQGAGAVLKAAGAAVVAAVVVGRHVNRDWHENDRRIEQLGFDWNTCALCARQQRQMATAA